MKNYSLNFSVILVIAVFLLGCGGSSGTSEGMDEINHKPEIQAINNISTLENQSVDINLSATDADGDTLTYTIVKNPTKGTLAGEAPNIIYTPNKDRIGVDSFVIKANDGKIDSDSVDINITTKGYRVSFIADDLDSNGTDYYIRYTYDENGYKITAMYEDKNGIRVTGENYTYDENGNILTKLMDNDHDGLINDLVKYTYNLDGKLIEDLRFSDNSDIADYNITYKYDANLNLILKTHDYDNDGSIEQTFTYTYDDDGNITKEIGAGSISNTTFTYTYDDDGKKLNVIIDDDSDTIIDSNITNNYNSNGELISVITYDSDTNPIMALSFTYADDGKLMSESRYTSAADNPFATLKETITYNADGNILIKSHPEGGDVVVDERNTYDSHGRLISNKKREQNRLKTYHWVLL